MRIAILKSGDHDIELIQYVSPDGERVAPERHNTGAAHLAFRVSDADVAYRELLAKGVRFTSTPQDFGTVRACYFSDPDGITLELIEFKSQSQSQD